MQPSLWDLVTWPYGTSSFHLSSNLSSPVASKILKLQTTAWLLAMGSISWVRGAPIMAHNQKRDEGDRFPFPHGQPFSHGRVGGGATFPRRL